MPISCPQCHAQMPDDVAFCPGCGLRMWVPGREARKLADSPAPPIPAAATSTVGAEVASLPTRPQDNLMAALAYVTFIPAIVFVLIKPVKRNRFVRFHSFQSIFLALAVILIAVAMRILYSVLALIPVVGYLIAWLSVAVTALGCAILWLVLLVKAMQGQAFQLPWIGSLAEKS